MGSPECAGRVLAQGGGIASRAQLRAAGVHRNWLARQLAAGVLREILPGVIATRDAGWSLRHRLLAALLYAGPDAAADHRTAAHLWGLAPEPRAGEPLQVAVPHGSTRPAHRAVRIRQRRRAPVLQRAGFRVVPPAEVIVAMASDEDADRLRLVTFDAIHRRLIVPEDLGGGPTTGRAVLRQLREEAQAGAVSGGEAQYWRLLTDAGLPLPELNAEVVTARGCYYVDALWRELALGAEIDGRSVHGQAHAFEADRTRQNAIQTAGIVLIRFPVSQVLRDPDGVVRETREALAARAAALGHRARPPR